MGSSYSREARARVELDKAYQSIVGWAFAHRFYEIIYPSI